MDESSTHLRAILESTSDLIWSVDAERFGLLAFNRGLQDYFRKSRGIILARGMRPEDLFPPGEYVAIWRGFYQRALRDGPYTEEYQTYSANRILQLRVVPLAVEGRAFGVSVFGHDVTEERRLARQLQQAQRLEAIGRIAGGVAHDFNNVLTVIMSQAGAMRRALDAGQPVPGQDVDEILGAAMRARHLTRQLLTFARRRHAEPVACDLDQLLRGVEKLLRRALGDAVLLNVRLRAPRLPVFADPAQLEQVILNLAVNARDAMPDGGDLVIEAAQVEVAPDRAASCGLAPGPHARLSFHDSGRGMAPEVLARAFEPFFTTKGEGQGTGLGLATVYGIVKQAGGHAGIESFPGRGTSVEILLPLTDRPVLPHELGRELEAPSGTETVLLVEDDGNVRDSLARTLRASGYRVLAAGGCAEARAALAAEPGPVQLLLSDVRLADGSGPELASALRGLRPAFRTLFISGHEEAPPAAAEPLLGKPFTSPQLLVRVRQVLDAPPGR